jgi:hypothetical protein
MNGMMGAGVGMMPYGGGAAVGMMPYGGAAVGAGCGYNPAVWDASNYQCNPVPICTTQGCPLPAPAPGFVPVDPNLAAVQQAAAAAVAGYGGAVGQPMPNPNVPPGFAFPQGGFPLGFPGGQNCQFGPWNPWSYCGLFPRQRGLVCTQLPLPNIIIPAGTVGPDGVVTPGPETTVNIQPPVAVQIKCLRIPSDIAGALEITNITNGLDPLFLGSSGAAYPARLATEVADSDCGLSFGNAIITPNGNPLSITFRNTQAADVRLAGSFQVTALYC